MKSSVKGQPCAFDERNSFGKQKTVYRSNRMLGYQPYHVLFEEAYKHHIFLSPSITASNGDTEGGAPVSIVVSFQVMEHLPEPEFFLSECFRILKSKGRLFLTVPFMWHVHEAPYDYYRYTRYGLEYLLNKNGFVHIEIKENTGFWQTFVLKFNYHTTRFSFGFLRYLWIPVWWTGQIIAPILDRYDKHPEECASYTVLAEKI